MAVALVLTPARGQKVDPGVDPAPGRGPVKDTTAGEAEIAVRPQIRARELIVVKEWGAALPLVHVPRMDREIVMDAVLRLILAGSLVFE